ncbi:DUF4247 domain-containing protein [Desertibacillus haloalkaliphilus]|uniref:DUF4247 domain-containing protein n=1 Tax=Desertibacillus haloalkaliphilus TaxID=1328930 RepID=UPI001C2690D8|nr:DUF4247 domain-containing protein [Desertibacillus haloalkaliphilus]MBU8908944.1 DUF4247 domain-containing protein [Desertibacillus haloalkaliphilus]
MKSIYVSIIFIAVLFISACSVQSSAYQSIYNDEIASFIKGQYPLFDVVASSIDSSNYSEIYVAEGKGMAEVATEIEAVKEPVQSSDENDGKQVLVYDQFFVILSVAEDNRANTLIELANKEFVRNNFNPSFFEGMLLMSMLNNMLGGNDWGNTRRQQCNNNPDECYRGYSTSGGSFKGYQNSPTVRGGSATIRGGGPGTGK